LEPSYLVAACGSATLRAAERIVVLCSVFPLDVFVAFDVVGSPNICPLRNCGEHGVGLGFNTGPLLSVAVSAAPKAHAGAAASVVNTARMIGATVGVAVLGAIFAAHAGQNPVDPQRIVAGLHPAFVVGALSEIVGALAAWRWIPVRAWQLSRPLRLS
jgi:MFS family permease